MWLKIEETLKWLDQRENFELFELLYFWEHKRAQCLREVDYNSYSQWLKVELKIFCLETGRFERNVDRIKEKLICGKNN